MGQSMILLINVPNMLITILKPTAEKKMLCVTVLRAPTLSGTAITDVNYVPEIVVMFSCSNYCHWEDDSGEPNAQDCDSCAFFVENAWPVKDI